MFSHILIIHLILTKIVVTKYFFSFGNCIMHEFVHVVTMEQELTPKTLSSPLVCYIVLLTIKERGGKYIKNNKILTVRIEILIK